MSWDRPNGNIVRSGYVLNPQSKNPIALGDVGLWFDGTTIYWVDASGNLTPSAGAGHTYHEACRLATNAALGAGAYDSTLLTFTQTAAATEQIDSTTVAVGDRILVKNQVDQTQNGIYVVTVKGTGSVKQKLTRAPDCNTSVMFEPAFITTVSEGSVNADSIWEFSADAPFVMDTNNATFGAAPLSITYGAIGDMATTGLSDVGTAGVANKVSRADHVHPLGANITLKKEVDHTVSVTASTTAATAGGALAVAAAAGKTSGTGGAASLAGGASDTTGTGGTVSIVGGIGGSVSGAGGAASVTGGAGTLNANGGAASIDGGAKNGSGTDGVLSLGATNASAITLGRAGKLITRQGPIASGASTDVIADPGTGVAIPVTQNGYVPIVTAGAETNTLAIPTFRGQRLTLTLDTRVGGNRVVTSAQRINQAGNTVMTFDTAADTIELVGITVAGVLRWQVAFNEGVTLS